MIYLIIGMSVLFIATGFIVTERNAKNILAGYNTMSEEERKKVDIRKFIPWFRKFHIFLGISFFLGSLLVQSINENVTGIFLAVYPILAYIFFISTSSKYSKGQFSKWNKLGVFILVGTLLLVLGLLGYGYKESKLVINSDQIEIRGIYGETISKSEIQSIEIVSQIPDIRVKTNGFALGSIKKGYFRTNNDEVIKLILNSSNNQVILITKTGNKKVYYSAKNKSNELIADEIIKAFDGI